MITGSKTTTNASEPSLYYTQCALRRRSTGQEENKTSQPAMNWQDLASKFLYSSTMAEPFWMLFSPYPEKAYLSLNSSLKVKIE